MSSLLKPAPVKGETEMLELLNFKRKLQRVCKHNWNLSISPISPNIVVRNFDLVKVRTILNVVTDVSPLKSIRAQIFLISVLTMLPFSLDLQICFRFNDSK